MSFAHRALQAAHLSAEAGVRGVGQRGVQRLLQLLPHAAFVLHLEGKGCVGGKPASGIRAGGRATSDLAEEVGCFLGVQRLHGVREEGVKRRPRLLLTRLLVLVLHSEHLLQLLRSPCDQKSPKDYVPEDLRHVMRSGSAQ